MNEKYEELARKHYGRSYEHLSDEQKASVRRVSQRVEDFQKRRNGH